MDLHPDTFTWLISQAARLRAAHGDTIGTPELIEPTGDFFPDEFHRDQESVERLLARFVSYSPLDEELDLRVGFEEDQENAKAGGCGSTACGKGGSAENGARGRVVSLDEGYGVVIDVRDAGNPLTLTAALARSVGTVVLAEAGEEVVEEDLGAVSEVCATVLGFGLILLNGSAVYAKGCGGVKLHRATHLSVAEHAGLLALFCRVYEHEPRRVKKHLEVTQAEAFDAALAWVDSNPLVIAQMRETPEILESGAFELSPPKSFLGRLFVKKVDVMAPAQKATAAKKERSSDEERRIARAKALVDEALGSS
jgi:hypothetical protein